MSAFMTVPQIAHFSAILVFFKAIMVILVIFRMRNKLYTNNLRLRSKMPPFCSDTNR